MIQAPGPLPDRLRRSFTLRVRLALWSAGLLVLGCVVAVVAIDAACAKIAAQAAPESLAMVGRVRDAARLVLGLIALGGGLGAYWIAGVALRPVRTMATAARRITADTLDTRLALAGPDDELKELAVAFDAMLDRLERAFARQAQFVADAAHELRTPLAALRTTLEVGLADADATAEERWATAAACERQLARLERLAADLLLLTPDEGQRRDEPVVLGPLVEDVVEGLRGRAEAAGVALRLGGDPEATVRGDAALLARVVANLVENAVAYNRPGGTVRVTLVGDGAEAGVVVADDGIGIDRADWERIFDRFYRVDRSRVRHRGGVGLGLAIVRDLVGRHGGRVELDSAPGRGSTFAVRLPAAPAAPRRDVPRPDRPPPPERPLAESVAGSRRP